MATKEAQDFDAQTDIECWDVGCSTAKLMVTLTALPLYDSQ